MMSEKFIKASYDRKTGTAQFHTQSGRVLLRSSGSIAWRFNNPGNLTAVNMNNKTLNNIGVAEVHNPNRYFF